MDGWMDGRKDGSINSGGLYTHGKTCMRFRISLNHSVPACSIICVQIASGKSCSENVIPQGPGIAASAESVLRIPDNDKL